MSEKVTAIVNKGEVVIPATVAAELIMLLTMRAVESEGHDSIIRAAYKEVVARMAAKEEGK